MISIALRLILLALPTYVLAQNAAPVLNVNFEMSNIGGFSQSNNDAYDWIRRAGRNRLNAGGPLVDHTTTTSVGRFMFVNTVSWRTGSNAELKSPIITPTSSPRCVRYFFYMNGINPGALSVRLKSGLGTNVTSSVVLDQQSGNRGQGWNRGLASIPTQETYFQILFEATSDNTIGGEIALDDVQLLDTTCPEDELNCSFESPELCGFIQDTTDDGNLIHMGGKTDSFFTGPSYDHTYGNSSGHYVYMEATPLGRSQRVRLISPVMQGILAGQEAHCLVFWYHMYGLAIDSLAVYLVGATTETTMLSAEPDWILRGNRGNRWRATEIPINLTRDYKIIFEFTRGVRYDGDIAIDDVIVTDYACPGNHIYQNVSSVSCDFEEADICHYTQDKSTDTEDWQWGNGATYVDFTGPSVDHTRGDELGFYLYFERSIAGGIDARILSPPIQPQTTPSCVEFWYHMYGTDVNALRVYIKKVDEDYPNQAVWNLTANRGDVWHRGQIIVPASVYPLQIAFHAIGGTQFRDNIAIDDVRLYEGTDCPVVVTQVPSTPTIPPLQETISCTFEKGFCNFTQDTEDVFDWRLGQGPNSDQGTEKMIDHTFGNETGTYAFIDTAQRFLRTNDKARIKSALLQPSSKPRCFTFHYFMSSPHADFLNVYIVAYGGTMTFDPQLVIYGKQEPKWLKASVPIPPSTTAAINIIVEGVIGPSPNHGDIAIDDVLVENNACNIIAVKPPTLPLTADCDFEPDSECGYIQSTNDQFNWTKHRSRTDSEGTGPTADHTLGTMKGHYFYAEASQPRRPKDRAVFLTPPIAGNSQPICLKFYCHMSGIDTGSLRISIVLPGHQTGSAGLEILRLNGQKMNSWLPVYVDVLPVDGPLQIKFEAVIGQSYKSDIAIDDIAFLRRPCSGLPSESLCDFERGLHDCGYQETSKASVDFQWSWYDSQTPATPDTMETLTLLSEDGIRDSFLYITVTEQQAPGGATANLSSPLVKAVSLIGHCVDFDYVLQGNGELELSILAESDNGSVTFLQTLSLSTIWEKASIPVDADTQFDPFKITFVAKVGTGLDDDIEALAIDSVAISIGTCKTGSILMIEGKHIPVLALGLVLAIAALALLVVCIIWIRKRQRTSFPVWFMKRRPSDENPITMSLSNDSSLDNASQVEQYS